MTAIYLAGGENATHQGILASCAAMRIAVNVTSLLRRKRGTWKLDLPYTDWEWVAYCDGPATPDDLEHVLEGAARPPRWVIGPSTWADHEHFLPLWNGEGPMPEYRPSGMVITDRVFRDKSLSRQALAARSLGTILGTISGSIDPVIGRYDLVISGSWWSSFKYGETQVWDGRKMHRYNAERKSEVRTRHREHILALGIDADQVLLDDPNEASRLAVASWQALEANLSGANLIPLPTRSEVTMDDEQLPAISGSEAGRLDIHPSAGRHRVPLPVIGLDALSSVTRQVDGTEFREEQEVIRSRAESLRTCNNCYLAQAGCPAAAADQTCAYEIPVEIRSKDQLQAVMQAMIEMQTQRVLQARFAEEITGQELSPEVGRELDRLFGSVEKMRDIMDNRETLKMTVESRGHAGVLSRLFGTSVGDNARALAQPLHSDAIIDAVVDDD